MSYTHATFNVSSRSTPKANLKRASGSWLVRFHPSRCVSGRFHGADQNYREKVSIFGAVVD